MEEKSVKQPQKRCGQAASFAERLKKNDFVKNAGRYTLLLPSLVFMIIFAYLPMVGIVIAFQNYDPIAGFFGSTFTWFENFKFFFVVVIDYFSSITHGKPSVNTFLKLF